MELMKEKHERQIQAFFIGGKKGGSFVDILC